MALTPRISLVVATYNRAESLAQTLEHVARQTLPREDFEVVVCDDGSTDATRAVLDAWQQRSLFALSALHQPNQGQAVARDAAIRRATAQRVAMVDDDMAIAPNFLEEHLRAAQPDPDHLIVLGRIVAEEGWEAGPLHEATRNENFAGARRSSRAVAEAPNASSFLSANVSVPRALYLASGGFDPSLRLDEDRELGIRLERGGGVLVRGDAAWAVHRSDGVSYRDWEKRQYEYGWYAVQIWEKYGRDPYLHPLRNYVNGSRLNHMAVRALAAHDRSVRFGSGALRHIGEGLAHVALRGPAIATHRAILALQYHAGVRDALGSWKQFLSAAAEFERDADRPFGPTGRGPTTRARRDQPGPVGGASGGRVFAPASGRGFRRRPRQRR